MEIASLVEKGIKKKLSKMANDKNEEEKQRELLNAAVMGVLQEVGANVSSTGAQNPQQKFLTAILKKQKKE